MNIYKKIEKELHLIVQRKKEGGFYPSVLVLDKIEVTPPKDPTHGDMATNAALVIAPQVSKNPKVIAEDLLEDVKNIKGIAKAEIAGPGFINMTLAPSVWQEAVADILKQGVHYGDSDRGNGQRVNVEYVSANPTGPMHVGHGRGAVYGDALASLLVKAGYDVTKEYYINDSGLQVIKLAMSAYIRYLGALYPDKQVMDDLISRIGEANYPGDYLIPVGEALKQKYGDSLVTRGSSGPIIGMSPETIEIIQPFAIEAMMQLIKGDLAVLGIHHDVFSSEGRITEKGEVDEAIKLLDQKGLIYRGILEPPKGKAPEDWEPREQTLFRSTQFGDDIDRPVKKSDGSWTYFAPDIAYHFDKCKRGFNLLIDVFGADHGGYVKRLKAAVTALSDGKVELDIKLCQLVKFMRNGEPLKMSKRAGTFVTVREVVDEVGKDVFRFIMLTRKNDVPLDFDFAKVMEQSKDNPVFYVQYAHARARSVIRRAAEEMPDAFSILPLPLAGEGRGGGLSANLEQASAPSLTLPPAGRGNVLKRLIHPEELTLIRLMCNWPRLVEQAAAALEPHRVAFYLHDLAAAFHGFWHQGNDDLGLRFLVKDDIELTAARIMLAQAVSQVIASGLGVLGVEPLEEMR